MHSGCYVLGERSGGVVGEGVSVEMMFCFLDTTSMPETQEMDGRADF